MEKYPKNFVLKDGSEIIVREFNQDDMDKLMIFFSKLPVEDRMYLRCDVTNKENIVKRFNHINSYMMYMLVALHDDKIIGQCNLSRPGGTVPAERASRCGARAAHRPHGDARPSPDGTACHGPQGRRGIHPQRGPGPRTLGEADVQ